MENALSGASLYMHESVCVHMQARPRINRGAEASRNSGGKELAYSWEYIQNETSAFNAKMLSLKHT